MRHKVNLDGEKIADLDGTIQEFSESVNNLLENLSLENAMNAQLKNMENLALIYDRYLLIGGVSIEVTEKFLQESYYCVAGLNLIKKKGDEDYIPSLIKNIERRIDFAEGIRKLCRN